MENIGNTTAKEVIDSFESTFADKRIIPYELEVVWLEKAVARYSLELDTINYIDKLAEFDTKLDDIIISTLGIFMKQLYQEREVSLVNKRISIVGKDISIDGSNGAKTSEKAHLEYSESQSSEWIENQKPSAYI